MPSLFFLTGPTAAAAGSICTFLCKLHNFLTKIRLNFVHLDFPFSIDKFSILWYNIIVVKGGKVNGREKPTTATRKNFLKKFQKTP